MGGERRMRGIRNYKLGIINYKSRSDLSQLFDYLPGKIQSSMKLLEIKCIPGSPEHRRFHYIFESNVSIMRGHVSAYSRINSDVYLFRIPFTCYYLLRNELLAVILILSALIASSHRFINALSANGLSYDSLYPPIGEFIGFFIITVHLLTRFYYEFNTFSKGETIKGIIVGKENYEGFEDTKSRLEIQLPGNEITTIDDIYSGAYTLNQTIDLRIHPDLIPYTVLDNKLKIYSAGIIFFVIEIILVIEIFIIPIFR